MKKPSQQQRLYFATRARRYQYRRLRWKEWRRVRNASKHSGREVILERDGEKRRGRAIERWPLPEIFCLTKNPQETLKALDKVRIKVLTSASQKVTKSAKAKPLSGYFDFATVKEISPSAALVLAAIYDRAKSTVGGAKLHTVNETNWEPSVRQMLVSVGFHEILDMARPKKPDTEGSKFLIQKFVSGRQAEGEPVGKLQEALENLLPPALSENLKDIQPYGGMFEAILNSRNWAYPEDHKWDFTPLKNWWLTGAVDLEASRVTVVVYDQGVTIPVSLPHWKHWDELKLRATRFLSRAFSSAQSPDDLQHSSNDGVAIRLAMKIAKSKTLLPQHGKGLHTMVEVAERAAHGRLRIISRCGEYLWETGIKPKYSTNVTPIGGTLIEWTLDL